MYKTHYYRSAYPYRGSDLEQNPQSDYAGTARRNFVSRNDEAI